MIDITDDDDEDGFFGDDATPVEKATGLLVDQRARQIFDAQGALVWDELSAKEAAYRREGRPPILFTKPDDETGLEVWDDADGKQGEQADRWRAIMGLDRRLPTVAEVERFVASGATG